MNRQAKLVYIKCTMLRQAQQANFKLIELDAELVEVVEMSSNL